MLDGGVRVVVYTDIQKGEFILRFRLKGEFYMCIDTVYMLAEIFNVIFMNHDKSIIYIPIPHFGGTWSCGQGLLKFLHVHIYNYGRNQGALGDLMCLLIEGAPKCEIGTVQTEF